ncbi:MAG: glycosyltransferase [Bacteroidales bacterium]
MSTIKTTVPLVSVVLPFYKPGKKLEDAVRSIVEQTFTRWELILVNNNACEISSAIAEKWSKKNKNIILIHEPVQGIAHAINTGIRHASAELVARMDADDISLYGRLSKQADYMLNHPETGVVSTSSFFCSDIDKNEGFSVFVDWQNNIITNEQHYLARFIESPLAHPTVMFRKKLIDLYGYYATGNVPEDYELWLRWFEKGVGFYKIPEKLVQWNDHGERLSRIHHGYSKEAFMHVRYEYLARYLNEKTVDGKKIIVCGGSKNILKKVNYLAELGVNICGVTDIIPRKAAGFRFFPDGEINDPGEYLILNLISKRGIGKKIKDHFTARGFIEGKDVILAG